MREESAISLTDRTSSRAVDIRLAARKYRHVVFMFCAAVVDDTELYGAVAVEYMPGDLYRDLLRRMKHFRTNIWISGAYPYAVQDCLRDPVFDRHRGGVGPGET